MLMNSTWLIVGVLCHILDLLFPWTSTIFWSCICTPFFLRECWRGGASRLSPLVDSSINEYYTNTIVYIKRSRNPSCRTSGINPQVRVWFHHLFPSKSPKGPSTLKNNQPIREEQSANQRLPRNIFMKFHRLDHYRLCPYFFRPASMD